MNSFVGEVPFILLSVNGGIIFANRVIAQIYVGILEVFFNIGDRNKFSNHQVWVSCLSHISWMMCIFLFLASVVVLACMFFMIELPIMPEGIPFIMPEGIPVNIEEASDAEVARILSPAPLLYTVTYSLLAASFGIYFISDKMTNYLKWSSYFSKTHRRYFGNQLSKGFESK